MSAYVGVVGVGGVGSQVLEQLATLQKTFTSLRLVLICRSKQAVYIAKQDLHIRQLNPRDWSDLLSSSKDTAMAPTAIVEYLAVCGHPAILIDNTSSEEMAKVYSDALAAGVSVVTPNKKAFSGDIALWDQLISQSRSPERPKGGCLYHESTVGAGLPIISTLKDLIITGDRIRRIEGVFSGTMSFLFNNFAPANGQGRAWSEAVTQAKAAGFTEPDPRDDLNGLDVARKLAILARVAGLPVKDTAAISIQSLIPAALESCTSGDEFMQKLPEHDGDMAAIKSQAQGENRLVRFVGSIDFASGNLTVGLQKIEHAHPIAGLQGSDNIVSFYTDRYPEQPLVIQGAGAGAAVTAMGVISDVVKVLGRLGLS